MQTFNFTTFLRAVRKRECVLVLGPYATFQEQADGRRIALKDLLAQQLATELATDTAPEGSTPVLAKAAAAPAISKDLAYLASRYENERSRTDLSYTVEDFYEAQKNETHSVLDLLVRLPFRLIINTSPDHLLAEAFRKTGAHYREAAYRKGEQQSLSLDTTPDSPPLIYNLLGSVADANSLVLSQKDQLDFVHSILQKETALPYELLRELDQRRLYLFIGFDFEYWYLRILLRVLKLSDDKRDVDYALGFHENAGETLRPTTQVFFSDQYRLQFLQEDPECFLADLLDKINNDTPLAAPETPTLRIFCLYDTADEREYQQLKGHLAPLRRRLNARLEGMEDLLAGDDYEQALFEKIELADGLIILVSADLLANEPLYLRHVQRATSRHQAGGMRAIPVLLRSCTWEGEAFAKLPTMLPRDKKPMMKSTDRAEGFRDVATEIEIILQALKKTMNRYRYPGIWPFQPEDAPLFFGRERETRELFNILSVEDLLVLFSKSGIGKTSLINAGLTPLLLPAGIFPVFVRFLTPDKAPEQEFADTFCESVQKALPASILPDDTPDTLWELLKNSALRDTAGKEYTPLIILDQFEELFSKFEPEHRAAFTTQLADLAVGKMPEPVRLRLRERVRARSITSEETRRMEQPPRLKLLLSIRSDMLHLLDELTEQMPYILRSRYQLLPLKATDAREAMVRPAVAAGDYDCPPFGYTGAALDNILDTLANRGEVESFQLQLVCRAIENKIVRNAKERKASTGVYLHKDVNGLPLLEPGFYGGGEGIARLLEDFYAGEIEKLDEATRLPARLLIENELLTDTHRRRSVDADTILVQPGINPELLRRLVDARLLRKEPRNDMDYYEISHDTLIAPVLKFKKEREEAEEKIRLAEEARRREAELAEEKKQREKEQAQRRRATLLAALAVVAFVIAAGVGIWAWGRKVEADRLKDEAIEAESTIQSKVEELQKETELQQSLREAQAAKDTADLRLQRQLAAEKQAKQEQLEKRLADARAFRQDKRFRDALRAYDAALSLSDAPAAKANIQTLKRQTLQEQTDSEYARNRDIGLKMKAAGECRGALRYLKKALESQPDDAELKRAVDDCEK